MTEKIKTAVIGVGYLGRFHAQKYAANPQAELVAVTDLNKARAEEIGTEVGCKAVADFSELIGKIDAASVAVTTSEHLNVAAKLLDAGIHCLVEKPIAADIKQADMLIEAAEKTGAILQIGHLERFNPPIAALKEYVSSPVMIEAKRLTPFRGRGIDVDVVLDLMIHDIDIILGLTGEMPSEIKAVGAKVITELLDVANARLEFPSGTVADLTATRVSGSPMRKIQVLQVNSHITVDCTERTLTVYRKSNGEKDIEIMPGVVSEVREFSQADPLNDEISAFIQTIIDGNKPLVGGREGRQALEVALEIADLISRGRPGGV